MDALYMTDSYCREFEATVASVADGRYVVLDRSAFYPQGGGQPSDTGVLLCNTGEYPIVSVKKINGIACHETPNPGLKAGDRVLGKINWERRYALMRMHTAAHLLAAIIHTKTRALITGNQLDVGKSRIDFSLEQFDQEKFREYVAVANELIRKDLPVSVSFMPRDEALKMPGMVKLAGALPPSVQELRIVSIEGVDTQADGGTHVKSLKEIGTIELLKMENKGKDNRRMYYACIMR
ncbi:TPA: alanyl-tRNA editing protein [Candidatus Woesearchaeota archaeon]|nr:alanyl-tRNA editing protein [Candidatus Woesearchaeota archaeon]HII65189.1 alanyl-tRNA editing protein [Candidatus Woesearchaeota archaeon]